MFSIGIIGNGFVGRASFQLVCDSLEIRVYDINSAYIKEIVRTGYLI